MESFLEKRSIIININNKTNNIREIEARILQKLIVSPILYLFFNTPLLEIYLNIKLKAAIGGFINNIYLLIYRNSAEKNCKPFN